MAEEFDFAWHEQQFIDVRDAPPTEIPEHCWQCDYLFQRLPWPGYEQHVLDDSDEWHVLPGRYDWSEESEVKHYCARRQCWRDPDSDGCKQGVCVATD